MEAAPRNQLEQSLGRLFNLLVSGIVIISMIGFSL
jgi:hypothetical protein